MWKPVAGVISLIVGVLVYLTYQTPKDAISTFSKSLKQLGIDPPRSLQDPITDRMVRTVGVVVVLGLLAYLCWATVRSIRYWWKHREPKYPLPFNGRGKEHLPTMTGQVASRVNGIVELGEGDKILTREYFSTPVAFRIRAKTNSTNLRLSYVENEIIFNWEQRMDLGLLAINGGPFHDTKVPRVGKIPVNEWVTIDLIYMRDSFTICVDGSERFARKADFSKCSHPLSVFTGCYATVHVKSVRIWKELKAA